MIAGLCSYALDLVAHVGSIVIIWCRQQGAILITNRQYSYGVNCYYFSNSQSWSGYGYIVYHMNWQVPIISSDYQE